MATIYLAQRHVLSSLTGTCTLWSILCWCYLRMYTLGKSFGKTFTALKCLFNLLLVAHQKVYKALLKLRKRVFSFTLFWCLGQKPFLFPFNKLYFLTARLSGLFLSAWLSEFFSSQDLCTGGLTPFRPLSGLQEIPVGTREKSRVLSFLSRWGLTPRVHLKCNPEISVAPGEEH